ncbi:hypothetical protein AQI95_17075 [Streptomyces yokosukanensis]|uniref:Lipoprotein n=1 Tax=Streptomyces yokosukanensis TaxID=67386 RepID=A0A101P5A0_9ACTN|nr:hypothetical protein [Streptomyces yokosukanensis]KUN05192.1 hypothetical protein AQI95_17075 [Streptomyces yokosukanensis]
MHRIPPRVHRTPSAHHRALLALLLTVVVLLSGCTTDTSAKSGPGASGGSPSVGASSPSGAGRDLAARYRKGGGDPGVYGITYTKGRGGSPVLTVWTRKRSGYGGGFDDFAKTLTSFLAGRGVDLAQGCVLTVYGPDGTTLHHYDTTLEQAT